MKQTLKKLSVFMLAFTLTVASMDAQAQVPQKFNYQGIARDAKGNPMSQQRMTLKLTVLPTADATEGEYEEIQTVTTNEFGLYTLQIGNGSPLKGEMSAVKWETGNKYIKVAIDPKGGSDFVDAGTNQLLSVPYAIYADKAGVAKNSAGSDRAGTVSTSAAGTGTVNYLTKFTAANTIYNSQLFDNGTNIGIGTTTPQAKLHLNNTSNSLTEIRVQGSHGGAGASSRLSFFGDNSSSFSSTANYAVMNKQSSGMTGNYSPGFKNSKLFTFANSQGSMILNAGGNIGFGYFNQAAGTTTTRMLIDSLTGNVGIGTTAPTAKLDVNGQIRMQGGSPGAGKIMTSNATGVGSWSTAAAAGLVSGSGTTNYVPKFTPDGNTLGNSKLMDNGGLIYNGTSMPDSYTGLFYQFPIGTTASSANIHTPTGSYVHNYINLTSNSTNPWQGIHFADSAQYYTWFNTSVGGDSVGSLYFNKSQNKFFLGDAYPNKGLQLQVDNGRMGNTIGNAHFNINTAYDTAGNFESNTSNYTSGILRGRYTGSLVNDHVAVSGYSNPDPTADYGIGVRGEGGFYGVQGISQITGSANYGASGYATSNGTSYGLYGYAGSNTTPGGYKYGTHTQAAGGANNYGLYAYTNPYESGNGTGVYALGKQTGVYGQADSASASQSYILGTLNGYKEAIGVVGKANFVSSSFPSTLSMGVLGTSKNTGYWNIGVFGEATDATYNIGVYGHNNGNTGLFNYAGYFVGDVNIVGNLAKSSGTFKIDHPQDPANKYLIHSFVESPDMMNVYNGNITTDANGNATVSLPSYFEAENKDFKYQLTVVDNSADFIMAKVSEKVSNNTFKIKTSKPNVEVSWQVTGVRQDAYANAHRIVDVVDKAPEDKGYYLHPELFGAPATQTVGPKGNPNAERHFLPSPEDHKKAMEDKKRNELEHLQKQQEAQNNWKTQELPKNTSKNGTGSLLPVK